MPLQRAQNAAARLVLGLDRRSSITTALRDLHWLPVKHRITFKVATLMHQALHRRCPAYFADPVAFSSTDSHRQLRSTTTRAAAIQKTRTQFGRRAFPVCGPDVWNSTNSSICRFCPHHGLPTRSSAVLKKLICSSLRLKINCFYFYFTIILTM